MNIQIDQGTAVLLAKLRKAPIHVKEMVFDPGYPVMPSVVIWAESNEVDWLQEHHFTVHYPDYKEHAREIDK